MKRVLVIGALMTITLFVLAIVTSVIRGLSHVSRWLSRFAMVALLSVPLAFAANPVIFRIDLWRAKHFVEASLKPRLEQHRLRIGAYPKEWRLWEEPFPDAPWLIGRFSYRSDGRTYELGVENPGVCGQVVVYSSKSEQWSESYAPCWY